MAASHAADCLLLAFASSQAVSFSRVIPSAPGAAYCRDMPVARALLPGGRPGKKAQRGPQAPKRPSAPMSWWPGCLPSPVLVSEAARAGACAQEAPSDMGPSGLLLDEPQVHRTGKGPCHWDKHRTAPLRAKGSASDQEAREASSAQPVTPVCTRAGPGGHSHPTENQDQG